MWIVPVPVAGDGKAGRQVADVVAHNEVLRVEHCTEQSPLTASSSGLNRFIKEVVSKAGEPQVAHSYRIVLLHPKDPHVIAVAGTLEEIRKDWAVLEADVMAGVRKNNANDSQEEICDFLLVKFDSYGRIQEDENAEQRSQEYCKQFCLEGEHLVGAYKCRLWETTTGMMYLSERYCCFRCEGEEEHKTVIEMSDINVIEKRKYYGRDNGIAVKTKDGVEYFWASFSVSRNARDEAIRVLQRLWERRMSVVMRSAEIGSTYHNPAGIGASTETGAAGQGEHVTDKKTLEEQQMHLGFNRRFRLPTKEQHLKSVECKTWEGSSFKHGQLFVSKHFLCFQTTKGKDVRVTIPFRETATVEKENSMLGVRHTGVKVTGKYRRYLYVFETQEVRDQIYSYILDRWSRSLFECDLMTMQHIPIARNVLRIGCMLGNASEFQEDYKEKVQRMEEAWRQYLKKFGQEGMGMAEDRDHLHSLIRQGGIPDVHRGWLWRMLSGAKNKANCAPFLGYYHALLDGKCGTSDVVEEEITKDLHRSFPEHEYFQTEEGIQSLRNVLVAYSRHNPAIGYCQSTNIITALLLVYVSEEWAFWMLASICEDLVPENYVQSMLGSIVAQKSFEQLLQQHLPKIHQHLIEIGVPVGVVSHGWFLTLFINYLPLQLALCVLDAFFFLRGHMLYAVGLGIFKHFELRILDTTEAEDITELLQTELHSCFDGGILKLAHKYADSLDAAALAALHSTRKSEVIRGMQTAAMQSSVRAASRGGTRFTEEEMHRLFDLFHGVASTREEYGVDFEQFYSIVTKVESWLSWRKDLAKRIFQAADKSENNLLDFVELVRGLEVMCKGTLREKLAFYWGLHGEGQEGGPVLLEIAEYYMTLDAVVRAYFEDQVYEADLNALVKWTFEHADREQRGRVSFEDVSKLLLPHGMDGTSVQDEAEAQLGLLEHILRRKPEKA